MVQSLPKIPGQAYLWVAVGLFAASNAIVQKLTTLGSQHLIEGRNPISPCNVLFVSNLWALLVLLPVFYHQLSRHTLRQVSRQEWLFLLLVAVLSGALAPALIFVALSETLVNNVILVGRIEPLLVLALSAWILRIRLNRWEVIGTAISLVGVILTLALQRPTNGMVSMGLITLGKGEVYTLSGVAAAAVATVMGKAKLGRVPLGLYTIVRTLVGTIVFFFLAIFLYGAEHFRDAASPLLWQWMLLYGVVVVAVGQLAWFRGLRASTPSEASLVNSFSPVMGILAAYLILGNQPMMAHYVGGAVILLGLLVGQRGVRQQMAAKSPMLTQDLVNEMEVRVGFKGI